MKISQSRSFAQRVRKLLKPEKEAQDQEIRKIVADPDIGESKKGELRGVAVHKFKLGTTPYLLAYRVMGEDLQLIMFGPHENYYRDIKKYVQQETSIPGIFYHAKIAADELEKALELIEAKKEKKGDKDHTKPVKYIQPAKVAAKNYLETIEDIEEFLEALKKELEKALQEHVRIRIQ